MRENVTIDDIHEFLVEELGLKGKKLRATSDLERELGCTGDDCFSMLEVFAKRFDVNLDSYLWYFHYDDEAGVLLSPGPSMIKRIFGRPKATIKRVPLSPQLLLDSAKKRQLASVISAP